MEIPATIFSLDKSLLYVSSAPPACSDTDDACLRECSPLPSVLLAAPEQRQGK